MSTARGQRESMGRALVAYGLVFVLLLHSALASVGAMRAASPDDAPISSVICSVAHTVDSDDGGPQTPTRVSASHCVLCQLAQGGCAPPVVVAASLDPPAPTRVVALAYARAAPSYAPPVSGWASSWSSRAPPLAA